MFRRQTLFLYTLGWQWKVRASSVSRNTLYSLRLDIQDTGMNIKNKNWAAAAAWGISIIFSFALVLTGIIHRNLILLPAFVLTMVLYLVFAGMAGAKEKYVE